MWWNKATIFAVGAGEHRCYARFGPRWNHKFAATACNRRACYAAWVIGGGSQAIDEHRERTRIACHVVRLITAVFPRHTIYTKR